MNWMLPFDKWTCYRGKYDTHIANAEDGILVGGQADGQRLISITYENDANARKSIIEYDRKWHALIQAHSYLYFE